MNYKEALDFSIDRTKERIVELGCLANEVESEHGKGEQWAAIRSARGGMIEVLDMMMACRGMASSFDDGHAVTSAQWMEMAASCINRGIDIMTDEQVGQWDGVRGVLECVPLPKPNA